MTHQLTNEDVADGILVADVSGNDSYMVDSTSFNAEMEIYKYIHLRMKNQSMGTVAQFYWTTVDDGAFDENKHVNFSITPNSGFVDYWLDMNGHAYWDGTINQLRLDPSSASSGHIELDFVRLQNRMSECGDFGYLPSDLNLDCMTDGLDMSILAGEWLNHNNCERADMNHDTSVDLLDLCILAQNWLDEQL